MGGTHNAQQLRKACRATEVVGILTKDKFVMPTLDNYDTEGTPKVLSASLIKS